jgi:amidase
MDAADLAFAGISVQAELIAAGEVSSRELLDVYLERIARLDPRLNAFRIVFAESARAEADQADARRSAGQSRPLLGVPIAVKDNMDVAGEVTPAGTHAHGGPAERDAEIVRRLREAGAVIIGKTNVPELCIWPFTESATFGITRNPWALERTTGGSSGGTAAAVAAGLVGAALGSDGGGSIRIPSAYCGLFGLKPQRGRVPLSPEPEHWHGLSVAGILSRSVRDTALFHDVIAQGPPGPGGPPAPAAPFADAAHGEPGRLRIAFSASIPSGLMAKLAPENGAALLDTAELLRSLGHDVQERDVEFDRRFLPAFGVRYLRGIHDDAAGMAFPQRLERRTRAMARAGGRIPTSALRWARTNEVEIAARQTALLNDHDVLMTPTTATPPPEVGRYEGRGWNWTFNGVGRLVPYCAAWNYSGHPAASVPAGFDPKGLPRAIQLIGRPGDEATLIALAAQIERERSWVEIRPPLAA